MRLMVGALCLSGCSWIFMERPPEQVARGQAVNCTASKGWVLWDAFLVLGDVVAIAANVYARGDGVDGDKLNALIGINVVDGALHLGSAISGSDWADKCVQMRGEAATSVETYAAKRVAPTKAVSDERRTIYGPAPLYCATTEIDVGQCFQSEGSCTAALAEGAPACEVRDAGACFTARKILDNSKSSTCAVSIKDCETRRAELAANPDYKVTACGIYRVEAK